MVAEVKVTNDSDVQMQVELSGQADNSLFYQFEKNSLTVEPNDVATFNLNLNNVEKGAIKEFKTLNVTAEITYKFDNQPNVSFSSELKFKPLFKNVLKESKVKVDGKLKEWADATWHKAEDMEGTPFDFDGPDDCSHDSRPSCRKRRCRNSDRFWGMKPSRWTLMAP